MSKQAERSLIGALLVRSESLAEVKDSLGAEHFADGSLKKYYKAAVGLADDGKDIDITTMAAPLKSKAERDNLAELLNVVPTSAYIKSYAIQIIEAYQKRISAGGGEPDAIVEKIVEAGHRIEALKGRLLPAERYGVADMKNDFRKHRGLPFGFDDLDKLASINTGAMTIVAGRPGAGKTAVLVNLALSLAKRGGVHYFTYEEPAAFILAKLVMIEAGRAGILDKRTNFNLLRRWLRDGASKAGLAGGEYKEPLKALEAALKRLDALERLKIYDKPLAVGQLCRELEKIESGVVIIDYVQKIPPEEALATRQMQLQAVSNSLLQTAIKTGLPIVCGAQLNRDETRETLSRLREAGDLEQDAGLIIGLKKREIEGQLTLEVEIAKNRYGRTTARDIELKFNGANFKVSGARGKIKANEHKTDGQLKVN